MERRKKNGRHTPAFEKRRTLVGDKSSNIPPSSRLSNPHHCNADKTALYEQFFKACESGDLETVRDLLSELGQVQVQQVQVQILVLDMKYLYLHEHLRKTLVLNSA